MAGLLGLPRIGIHDGQRLGHEAVDGWVAVRQREHLEAERMAVAAGRAHHILPGHQPLEHAVDLTGAPAQFLDDLGPRQSIGVLGQQLQDVQPLVQCRRAVARRLLRCPVLCSCVQILRSG